MDRGSDNSIHSHSACTQLLYLAFRRIDCPPLGDYYCQTRMPCYENVDFYARLSLHNIDKPVPALSLNC